MVKLRLSSRLTLSSRCRSAGDLAVGSSQQHVSFAGTTDAYAGGATVAAAGHHLTLQDIPSLFSDSVDFNIHDPDTATQALFYLTIDQQGRPVSQLRTGSVKKGGTAKKVLSILNSPRKALLTRTRSSRSSFALSRQRFSGGPSEIITSERDACDTEGRRAPAEEDLSLPLLGANMSRAHSPSRHIASPVGRSSRSLRHDKSISDRSHLVHVPLEDDVFDTFTPCSNCQHPNANGSFVFCSSCYMHWNEYETNANVMEWLHDEAPRDILPKVLSFLGPRKILLISRTNKSWRDISLSEPVWRTLCEDYGKWIPGKDSEPSPVFSTTANNDGTFWRNYYRDNVIVPIDYGTIESAFEAISSQGQVQVNGQPDADGVPQNTRLLEQTRNVRILLQPGKYVLWESLTVNAIGETTVSIETLDRPASLDMDVDLDQVEKEKEMYWNSRRFAAAAADQDHQAFDCDTLSSVDSVSSSIPRRRNASTTLHNILMCRSSSATESTRRNDMEDMLMHSSNYYDTSSFTLQRPSHSDREFRTLMQKFPRRAILILKSRKVNEPIIGVSRGTVSLRKLVLIHNSAGTDIWNGNAAVQIQPPLDANGVPTLFVAPSKPPTSILEEVDITSISGRGVVAIDGGTATIRNCYIHNCAATGVYVGGPGSVATIERTDVLQNGNGNEGSRLGVARGHSGVYLEQGVATLTDCNVSNNSLTGISAVSSDNAQLTVEGSDLVGNGTLQLEMPPTGSLSRNRSVSRNNVISARGKGRPRSGLVAPEDDGQDQANTQPIARRREAQHTMAELAIRQAMFTATA